MAFTPEQRKWLETAQGAAGSFEDEAARLTARADCLAGINAEIEAMRDALVAANAAVTVSWGEDGARRMDWLTGDRDAEVDTRHDLTGDYRVDPAAAKTLRDMHARLVDLQKRMEEATGPDGAALFTARDIERDLWSPLVRADMIPSNAVPDKYSQEAQVWEGACELYKGMLEEHSATASRHETARTVIGIASETVSLIGSVATEALNAADFANLRSRKEIGQSYALLRAEEYTEEQTLFEIDYYERAASNYNFDQYRAAAALAVGMVNGVLALADAGLDKRSKELGWKFASVATDQIGSYLFQSIDLHEAAVTANAQELGFSQEFSTGFARARKGVEFALRASKIVFHLHDIWEADDRPTQVKAATVLVNMLAGAIEVGFAAGDTQTGFHPTSGLVTGTGAAYGSMGGYIGSAIRTASNAAKIAEAVYEAKKSGKLKNPAALLTMIGVAAISPAMSVAIPKFSNFARPDIMSDYNVAPPVFSEDEITIHYNTQGNANDQLAVNDEGDGLVDSLLEDFPLNGDGGDARSEIAEKLAAEEKKLRDGEMSDFKAKLANDAEFRKAFIDDIAGQSEAAAEGVRALIGAADADPEALADKERADAAMKAVDKLISEADAANARWSAFDTLTKGGVAILVAALPVAGLAGAVQRLAADVAVLVRKSIELNKWLDNMALTYGNGSVYGPAIAQRLGAAKVQVSQQAVRIVFDAVGVASESVKLADIVGVASGLSMATNLGRALTEYGFKMHREAEVAMAWQLYKTARDNPGDRKAARKAVRWNSTLSKCVLAYGIVMDGDPIAKQVGLSCGLSPEVLADQKDVCAKVVTYFQKLYSDDPVVLRRVPVTRDWHPGKPVLSLDSWLRFKAAAVERARPTLDPGSARTAAADRALARLQKLIGAGADYGRQRDKQFPETDLNDPAFTSRRGSAEYRDFLAGVLAAADELIAALGAFRPLNGVPGADEKAPWTAGAPHAGMAEVAEALIAQAMLVKGEARYDLAAAQALQERQTQAAGDQAQPAGGAGASSQVADATSGPAPVADAPQHGGNADDEPAPADVQAAE